MFLSCKQRLELTIFGYIRLNYKCDIIDDIKKMCFDYYNKIEIAFDVYCDKAYEFVSDDKLEINISGEEDPLVKTFASSLGWSTGIHSWTLQVEAADSIHEHDILVGIISSEDIQNVTDNKLGEEYFLYTSNKAAVVYCLDNFSDIYEVQNGHEHSKYEDTDGNKRGDTTIATVTIVVNCQDWKISLYHNHQQLCDPFDIIKNKTYHPIFSDNSNTPISYKLIETSIDC